jgi:Ca2+-binding RTX toxin-like protein
MAYQPLTGEILVNGPTASNQTEPSVARLSDGRIVAVYATPSNINHDQWGIQAQYFDAAGNKIGNFFWITQPSLRQQSDPDVTALPGGGFALARLQGTSSGPILTVTYYSSTGSASGDIFAGSDLPFPINTSIAEPQITALSDTSVAVVWVSDQGDPSIRGVIVGSNAQTQEFTVATNAGGVQTAPQLATLSNGNFVVTWTDTSGVGGDVDGAIKAQIFSPTGVKIGGELLVNTTIVGAQDHPYVAAFPSGGFVAVWDSPAGDRGQIFDSAGNKVGSEFAVAGTGPISVRADGRFVVTYVDSDASGSGVFGQEYDSNGSPLGGPFAINVVTDGNQILPATAALGNDDIFVAWQDDSGTGGDSSGTGIKARVFTDDTNGTEGDDTFIGTAGNDSFNGLGGNDTFYFGNRFNNADEVDGGPGNDRLILQGQYANLQLTAANLANVETILLLTASNNAFGGAGATPTNYRITTVDANVAPGTFMMVDGRQLGANERLTFNGSAENNGAFFLYGGAAIDTLTGGLGRDTLDGGAGNDTLAGGGNDDIYFVDHPADVVLEAVGGGGFDAVYTRVNYVLRAGQEIEQLAATGLGLGQAIALTGNEFSQSLISGSGNDDLNGGGGADFLTANAGNDRLNGGTGIDVMTGGAGNDIYFVDNIGDVIVELAGEGSDSVYASATYQLSGGAAVELLATTGLAPGQAITLFGNDFAQSVIGATGDDILYGFGGADSLVGNEGADRLDGGAGDDGLRGDAGADVFQFTSVADSTGAGDNIFDFVSGTDRIDLSLIDANTDVEGNHAFTFIGSSAFSGTAGELRVESSGGLVNVLGDVDGDGSADLIIHLYNTGGATPVATDFVL